MPLLSRLLRWLRPGPPEPAFTPLPGEITDWNEQVGVGTVQLLAALAQGAQHPASAPGPARARLLRRDPRPRRSPRLPPLPARALRRRGGPLPRRPVRRRAPQPAALVDGRPRGRAVAARPG